MKGCLELMLCVFSTEHTSTCNYVCYCPCCRDLESRAPSRSKEAQMKKLRNECYSLWMDMLYRLSLANYMYVSPSIIDDSMHT